MVLEKKRVLRKMEFTFTDDEVHPDCHCEYHDVVLEDGVKLMSNTHREVCDTSVSKDQLSAAKSYVHPEPSLTA